MVFPLRKIENRGPIWVPCLCQYVYLYGCVWFVPKGGRQTKLACVYTLYIQTLTFNISPLSLLSVQGVGCDLRIGSSKKIDACGICGGNGSTCSQPLYQWESAPMSSCSVSCGGGKCTSFTVIINLDNHFLWKFRFRVQCIVYWPRWIY